MRTIFTLLMLLCFSASMTSPGLAQSDRILGPGDHGYKHEEMHPHYQKIFKSGKCHCKTGQCRPSDYRPDPDNTSTTGIEVKIDGNWYDVPAESLLTKNQVPPELWEDPAHVCAYPVESEGPDFMPEPEYNIECTVINSLS